jgi:hypothetical protein
MKVVPGLSGVPGRTPELARHMSRYPEGMVAYPHLYQKAAVEGSCEGE